MKLVLWVKYQQSLKEGFMTEEVLSWSEEWKSHGWRNWRR